MFAWKRALCVSHCSLYNVAVQLARATHTHTTVWRGLLIKGFVNFLFNLTVMNGGAAPAHRSGGCAAE